MAWSVEVDLDALARATPGYLTPEEGAALAALAFRGGRLGPVVEIGSWCGRSTVYLASAAASAGAVTFAVDHHRGSEEQQPGWAHHDPSVVDPATGRIDTLPWLRATLARAGLEEAVVVVVGRSTAVARYWTGGAGVVFVDGGHSPAEAHGDYEAWAPHVVSGGYLAIHDVFPDERDGGRPPFEVYQRALASEEFVERAELGHGSLRVLQRSERKDRR